MYTFTSGKDFAQFVSDIAGSKSWGVEASQIIASAMPVIAGMINPETGRAYGKPYAFAYMVELATNFNQDDWNWVMSLVVVNS
jgi:hypothetical protein